MEQNYINVGLSFVSFVPYAKPEACIIFLMIFLKKLYCPALDFVQLPQGCRVTTRRSSHLSDHPQKYERLNQRWSHVDDLNPDSWNERPVP